MGNQREYLIQAIVDICHKLDAKGWVANHDGNVTLRFEDTLLSTPTAVSKADIQPPMILTLDREGKKIQGIGKPFSEINLHLAAYQVREDIQAVVHAHPPYAMAWGMVHHEFSIHIPEAVISIGDFIPVLPYQFPRSPRHDELVTRALTQGDLLMMAGNGVLSVGRDVKEAFLRIELLEHLIKIHQYATTMGTPMTLPPADKAKLLEKRATLGLGPQSLSLPPQAPLQNSPISSQPEPTPINNPQDLIKSMISQELKKLLNPGK